MTQKQNKNNSSGRAKSTGNTRSGVKTNRIYANQQSYSTRSNYSNYSARNSRIYMANGGAGVMNIPGRVRDTGKYGERLREKQTYPNRRKRIITGKELTTPLRRRKIIENAQKARKIKAEDKVSFKMKNISAVKKKFPLNSVSGVCVIAVLLLMLICSHIVLNEKNTAIVKWENDIVSETTRNKELESQLEYKNIQFDIINRAISEFGMVNAETLQKIYISTNITDKVEIIAENIGGGLDLPGVFSALFPN